MKQRLESLYKNKEYSESTTGKIVKVVALIVSFPIQLFGFIANTFFDAGLETGEEKSKKEILKLKNEMGEDWFSYNEWKKRKQKKEVIIVEEKISVQKKSWLDKLWDRTIKIATMYTGTFIVVMFLNQLLFFGLCLNPICLVAAMPHVLLITVVIGSWLNKESGWGDKSKNKMNTTNAETYAFSDADMYKILSGKEDKYPFIAEAKKQMSKKERKAFKELIISLQAKDMTKKEINLVLKLKGIKDGIKELIAIFNTEITEETEVSIKANTLEVSETESAVKKLQKTIGNSNKYPSISITKKSKEVQHKDESKVKLDTKTLSYLFPTDEDKAAREASKEAKMKAIKEARHRLD